MCLRCGCAISAILAPFEGSFAVPRAHMVGNSRTWIANERGGRPTAPSTSRGIVDGIGPSLLADDCALRRERALVLGGDSRPRRLAELRRVPPRASCERREAAASHPRLRMRAGSRPSLLQGARAR